MILMLIVTLMVLLRPALAIYGISIHEMYPPNVCYTACVSVYSEFYLTCSTSADGVVSTSDDCKASNEVYLNSLAWCIETECGDKFPNSTYQEYWEMNIPGAEYTYLESLERLKRPAERMSEDQVWLNTSMLPNKAYYLMEYLTQHQFEMSEIWHGRMAFVLILIPWSLVIAATIYNMSLWFGWSRIIPLPILIWFRKHILTPALFKEKCCVPLTTTTPIDYLPPRIVAITIFIYYVLNVVFCAIGYETVEGNLYYPEVSTQLLVYVGNRTGVLSFVNIPILVLFSSRNNILEWLTGWSYSTFQLFHRHVSFIAVLQAIIHSVLYTVEYIRAPMSAEMFYQECTKPYFYWGIIATIAFSIIIPLSIMKLRTSTYEVFLVTHYALAILTLAACKYHISRRYTTEWGYNYFLYTTFAIWAFDFVIRFIKVIKHAYKGGVKARIKLLDSESKTISITYMFKKRFFQVDGDHYYFLYFPQLFPYFTSHPFTVSSWNTPLNPIAGDEAEKIDTSKISPTSSSSEISTSETYVAEFQVQCETGTTKKIYDLLEKNAFEPIELFSLLEGPYGGNKNLFQYDHAIIVTGGIGRTVAMNLLTHLNSEFSPRNTEFIIFNTDRYVSRLEHFKRFYLKFDFYNKVELELHDSNTGRKHIPEYIKTKVDGIAKNSRYPKSIAIICCGPPKMADEARRCAVDLQDELNRGITVDYITSSFSW